MSLSSSSTLAAIKAVYDDNLDYDLEGSAEKCAAFIKAARMLLRRMAEEIETDEGARIRDSYQKIQHELAKAERSRAVNDSTAVTGRPQAAVKHVSFAGFRD